MKIYFSEKNKKKLQNYIDEIVKSNQWSEGVMTKEFESDFESFQGLESVAVSSCGAALWILFEYAKVRGKDVVVPGNTFWATAAAAKRAGANVIYADCNREDLCLSLSSIKEKVTNNTAAVCLVHIGGHIAFEIEKISEFCDKENIILIEDCAHAHGASYKGRSPGSWGLGGAYSFYATKTLTTGEGGMVVSKDKNLIRFAKAMRNYGKEYLDDKIRYSLLDGFNLRMSEFTAAIGRIQVSNMPTIQDYKNELG